MDGDWTLGGPGRYRFYIKRVTGPCNICHIAPTTPKPGHGMGSNHAEPTNTVFGRPDDQGDRKAAQRAMRRKAAAARGRHSRPHTRPPSSFRCNTRHHHITYDHTPHLAASRRENSSTEGLQQHPERMTRACAVSIMNACLHELVWMLRASSELAWRLASTAQQQWCTGYEPGGCCCSHPSSARERLLSRRWFGTNCSSARWRFETVLGAIPRQR